MMPHVLVKLISIINYAASLTSAGVMQVWNHSGSLLVLRTKQHEAVSMLVKGGGRAQHSQLMTVFCHLRSSNGIQWSKS